MPPSIWIGDLEIPAPARLESLSQRYEPLGGQSILRMMTGRAVNQETWKKTRIVTSGSGWMPPNDLWRLDTSEPLVLKCISPLGIYLPAGTAISPLPSKRRADVEPWAVAALPGGTAAVEALAGPNAVTIIPHPDAIGHAIYYLPQFEVIAHRPSQQVDVNGAIFGWELVCEEI